MRWITAAATCLLISGCASYAGGKADMTNYEFDVSPHARLAETVDTFKLIERRKYTVSDIIELAKTNNYYVDQDFTYGEYSDRCPNTSSLIGTKQVAIDLGWNKEHDTSRIFVIIPDDKGYVRCIEARRLYRNRFLP